MEQLPSNLAVKNQYRLWILKATYFLEQAGYKPEDFIPGNTITIKHDSDTIISAYHYVLDAIEASERSKKFSKDEEVYVLPPDALWLEANLVPLEKILSKMVEKYKSCKTTTFKYNNR